jgi:hypothetical protein
MHGAQKCFQFKVVICKLKSIEPAVFSKQANNFKDGIIHFDPGSGIRTNLHFQAKPCNRELFFVPWGDFLPKHCMVKVDRVVIADHTACYGIERKFRKIILIKHPSQGKSLKLIVSFFITNHVISPSCEYI